MLGVGNNCKRGFAARAMTAGSDISRKKPIRGEDLYSYQNIL